MKILEKLFTWNNKQATKQILDIYNKKGFCIVNYLYFAPISSHKLLNVKNEKVDVTSFKTVLLDDYKSCEKSKISALYQNVLQASDILLPDGIALQIFYWLAKKKRLDNLNGTDFCPYFLDNIKAENPNKKINLILYGTYPDLLEKTKIYLKKQWFNVIYAQDWYINLDRMRVWDAIQATKLFMVGSEHINVLLVARATIDYPIQEIRSYANREKIKEYKLIVMNQWGTFDFWVWEQKRAPKLVRAIKLEWLWRLITDPKRNFKKVKQTMSLFIYIFSYLLLKKV